MKKIIELDKACGDLNINLPPVYDDLAWELKQFLSREFAFEPLDNKTIDKMNELVYIWLDKKGIKISEEES